jgi:adenosylcobinamide-GDP ribazoletransferase
MIPPSFRAACSFLTRLTPGGMVSESVLAASPRFFPLVGLGLGGLACLPPALGLARNCPAAQALFYLFFLFWATRGLHWDGLADCLDAWGSGARGERFQAILRDSRIGPFGVMGLLFVFASQFVCLDELLCRHSPQTWLTLILVPALGRNAMLALPVFLPPHAASTLGKLMAPGFSLPLALGWLAPLWAAFAAVQGLRAALVGLLLALLLAGSMTLLARREGGYNGDFLGCAGLLCESSFLAAPLL